MFRKLTLIAALAILFCAADATKTNTKTTKVKTDGHKVQSTTKAQRVKEFSICLYIPYGTDIRRLDTEEEDRVLEEAGAAGFGQGQFGSGYFAGYGYGVNLKMNYLSAIMYDCDSGTDLGTYGVFCQGDIGGDGGLGSEGFYGQAVQSDCEHNFAFTGEPGSALVLHTSESIKGYTVTTLGGSGKFAKSEVVSADIFETDDFYGFTLGYKKRGYNPLYWKDVKETKKSHDDHKKNK